MHPNGREPGAIIALDEHALAFLQPDLLHLHQPAIGLRAQAAMHLPFLPLDDFQRARCDF